MFDNEKLEFKCPNCNKKLTPTIKELKSNKFKCPYCGVKFNSKDFAKAIRDLENQLKRLGFK